MIRDKIKAIFDEVTMAILHGSMPVLFVPENDLSSGDECFNSYTFGLSVENMGTAKVSLIQNPYRFNKILALLNLIDQNQSAENVQERCLNKRAAYYSLLGQGIGSVNELDVYITDACFILGVSRSSLGINASAKGLMSGGYTAQLGVDCIQISNQFCHHIPQQILTEVQTVLVLEKDTVFQHVANILQANIDTKSRNQVLLVTGKGYPDYCTRKFLCALKQKKPQLHLFYLGDADPHGADIFFQYAFGSVRFAIQEAVTRLPLLEIQWLGPFMQQYVETDRAGVPQVTLNSQRLTAKDELKCYSLLSKPFLQDKNISSHAAFQHYKDHLVTMLKLNRKFEIEALSFNSTEIENGRQDRLKHLLAAAGIISN